MKKKILQEKRKKCLRFWIAAAWFLSIMWICPAAVSAEPAVIDSGTLSVTPWNEEKGTYTKVGMDGEYYAGWQLTEEGVLSIEGDGSIDAPSSYPWEDSRSKIVRVELGEGLINIPYGAFENYENLETIVLPSTFYEFGTACIRNCPKLTALIFKNGRIPGKKGDIWSYNPSAWIDADNQIIVYHPEFELDGEHPEYNVDYGTLKTDGNVKDIQTFCGYENGQMTFTHNESPVTVEQVTTTDSRVTAYDNVVHCTSCSMVMSREHHVLAADEDIIGYEYVPFTASIPGKQEILDFMSEYPADINAPVAYQTKPSTQSPYGIGVLSEETRQQLLNLINQIRFVAGVDADVPYSIENERRASAASLVMALNKSLSHSPSRPSALSSAAYNSIWSDAVFGAFNSNIAGGSSSINYNVIRYMDDRSEAKVGHRRHILKGNLADIGIGAGMTDNYSALFVDSNMGSTAEAVQAAWPANLTPSDFWYTGSLWSVNWGSEISDDSVSVTLKKSTGEVQQFSTDGKTAWLERGTVIFPANTTKADGESYTVFVKNETKKQILIYHVGFFSHGDSAKEEFINGSLTNGGGAAAGNRLSADNCAVTLFKTSYTYDGMAKKPSVGIVMTGNKKALKEGTDYTVTYKNNVNAGTAAVIITGTGNYTGTINKTFQIRKASPKAAVKKASFKKSALNKKAKTTTITVTPKKGAKITYKNTSSAKLKKYIKVNKKEE